MTTSLLVSVRKVLSSLVSRSGPQPDAALRAELDAARRRESELVASLAIVVEQQRAAAEQHRAAVAQHAAAVAQYDALAMQLPPLAEQHAAAVAQHQALAVQLSAAIEQHAAAAAQHAASVAQYNALAVQLTGLEDQLRGGPPQNPALGPSVVLSSLPKSGSIYQLTLFEKGLGYAARNTSLGYFPRDLADWSKLREAGR